MSKYEWRRYLLEEENVAGNAEEELNELNKNHKKAVQGYDTITVTCSAVLTLFCCS